MFGWAPFGMLPFGIDPAPVAVAASAGLSTFVGFSVSLFAAAAKVTF